MKFYARVMLQRGWQTDYC